MPWYVLVVGDGGSDIVELDNYPKEFTCCRGPLSSEQEAMDSLAYESGMPPTRCTHCGKWIDFGTIDWKSLVRRTACFDCNFWLARIEAAVPNRLVIDGTTYKDAGFSYEPNRSFLGFSGREFRIRRTDTGELIHTNNLWCGGKVPDRWKVHFPDNAEFLTEDKWIECGGTMYLMRPCLLYDLEADE